MKKVIILLAPWIFLGFACLDVNLLDEMQPWSTDPSSSEGNPDPGGSSDGESFVPQADPSDNSPPQVLPSACGASEHKTQHFCLAAGPFSMSLRFVTNEPAQIRLEGESPDLKLHLLSSDYNTEHHAVVAALTGPGQTSFALVATDASENATQLAMDWELPLGSGIALTEVLADPIGPEPQQEFVEVANLTPEPIDLSGWMIDDNADRNGDLLPQGSVLPAFGVALIVGPGFDPVMAGAPPSATIFSLDSSIGSSGLRNSPPESVELYDAEGNLVSAYPGLPKSPGEGCSAVRIHAYAPDGTFGAFIPEPSKGNSPGFAPM